MLNTPIENKVSNVSSYDVYKLTRVIIANTPSTYIQCSKWVRTIHYTKNG